MDHLSLVEEFFLFNSRFHAKAETKVPHGTIAPEDPMYVDDDHIEARPAAYTTEEMIDMFGTDPTGYSQPQW